MESASAMTATLNSVTTLPHKPSFLWCVFNVLCVLVHAFYSVHSFYEIKKNNCDCFTCLFYFIKHMVCTNVKYSRSRNRFTSLTMRMQKKQDPSCNNDKSPVLQ